MSRRQLLPGMCGVVILTFIIIASLFAPWLVPVSPYEVNMSQSLLPPSPEHIFGTDLLGREMLSRILYGGRSSLLLALAATVAAMIFGLLVGTIGGYYGGITDRIIVIILNIFQGLPGTSLMIAIAGIMGPSRTSLLLALVITGWAGFARIVRTEVFRLKQENFVVGLKSLGAGNGVIMWRHIVPKMKGNTMVLFTTRIGRAVLSISGLSFLGLGVQPPTPDWSVMINDARMNFRSAPHLIVIPGTCIVLLLLSINLTGDLLRDIFDKKSQEAGGYR